MASQESSKRKGKGREIEEDITGERIQFRQSTENQQLPFSSHQTTLSTLSSRSTTPVSSILVSERPMVRIRTPSPSLVEQPIASTSHSNQSLLDHQHTSTILSSNSSIDSDQPTISVNVSNISESGQVSSSSSLNREVMENNNNQSGVNFDESKQSSSLAPSNGSTPTTQSISRKTSPLPSRSNSITPNTNLMKDLRHSLPPVISLLTCRTCSKLLKDPTTLVCGHTLCMDCTLPISALRPSVILDHDSSIPSSESQFTRNPSVPLASTSTTPSTSSSTSNSSFIGPLQTLSEDSSDPTLNPSNSINPPSRSTVASISRGRPMCPYESCKGKEKVTTLAEPKVDFVLQKILGVLKREIGGLAEEVSTFGVDGEDREVEEEEDVPVASGSSSRPGLNSMPGGSESSIASSAGGGEDPSDEESKRVHRSPTWTTSKRVRRKSLATSKTTPEHIHQTRSDRLEDLFDFKNKSAPLLVELQSELDCQVCAQLLYKPITSPCGHTLCRACLARSLDHSDKCPICRAPMPSFIFFQSQPVNSTTSSLISTLFPSLIAERAAAVESEERSTAFDTPIFVCTLAWPNLPTYIHIFEPRYRLMMRRVMENGRKFGMVLPSRSGGGTAEYGTMLEVQSWNMIEDGRSIVETIGAYRFRLLEKDTLDGYTVGRVERVDDISEEQEAELERIALARNPPRPTTSTGRPSIDLSTPAPPVARPQRRLEEGEEGPEPDFSGTPAPAIELSTAELMGICLEFIATLRTGSAPWVLQRLNNTIGPMPTNPSDFSFWMAEVMPVDDHVKSALLQITSPRERLRLLVFWIEQFRSSWWFSGCNVM